MATISRDELHRAVEQLPDDRLTVAAELLEALAVQDDRVRTWRQNLSLTEESEIAVSLRREHTAEEWIADEKVAAWIESVGDDEPTP